jgi:hypothetical protein
VGKNSFGADAWDCDWFMAATSMTTKQQCADMRKLLGKTNPVRPTGEQVLALLDSYEAAMRLLANGVGSAHHPFCDDRYGSKCNCGHDALRQYDGEAG